MGGRAARPGRRIGVRRAAALRSALGAALLLCAAGASAQIMTYRVSRTKAGAPTLDGVLDDACWRDACTVSGFSLLGLGKGEDASLPATRAFLTYDADHLYVAYQCEEPLVDNLVIGTEERDGPTWQDDGVELFFNPSGDRCRYVQLAVNAKGVVMDGYIGRPGQRLDLAYETGAVANTRIGIGDWSIEIRIPFAGLPLIGPEGVWTFHLARNRRAAGQHLTALRSPAGGFHEVSKFDRLEGVSLPERPVGLLRASPGEMFAGTNICRATLKNWGDKPAPVTVSAGVEGAAPPKRGRQTVTIDPGRELAVEVPWDLSAEDEGARVGLEVHTGARLLQARSSVVGEVPSLFGKLRCPAFYYSQRDLVRIEMPVRLAEGSRRNLRLRWEAFARDGMRVGDGLTSLRDPTAVIRLYWLHWQPGRYTLRLALVRDEESVASAEQVVRLVMNPWGE